MANRNERAQTAAETVEILSRGRYTIGDHQVALAEQLSTCCRETRFYAPDDLTRLVESLPPAVAKGDHQPQIEVRNCTTFAAARDLLAGGFDDPLCLNFASAKNPGGGFLAGSQAQEECLARASGLYASLTSRPQYYETGRKSRTSLYPNVAIYSPQVPVFRDDNDDLLASPYFVSIVTSPAVNAGAVRANEPNNVSKIEPTMRHRIDSVLAIARHHQHTALVLGAWGCGVFRNDPRDIARWFHDALMKPVFHNAFRHIIFAVLDFAPDTPTLAAFRDVLATEG